MHQDLWDLHLPMSDFPSRNHSLCPSPLLTWMTLCFSVLNKIFLTFWWSLCSQSLVLLEQQLSLHFKSLINISRVLPGGSFPVNSVFHLQKLKCFVAPCHRSILPLPDEAASLKAHPRQRGIRSIVQVLSPPCLRGARPERKSKPELLFALQMLSVSSS